MSDLTNKVYAGEGATAEDILLGQVYEQYNDLVDMVREHRANDNEEDTLKALLSDEAEYAKYPELAEKIAIAAAAREQLAQLDADIQTIAAGIVAENSDSDFDVDKSRLAIRVARSEGMEKYKSTLSVFETLGHVTVTREFGKSDDVEFTDEYGKSLLELDYWPTVRAPKSGDSSTGNSDAAIIRKWAEENGIAVPARGRIPAEVRSQYEAANSTPTAE